jgi:hypothetical protein
MSISSKKKITLTIPYDTVQIIIILSKRSNPVSAPNLQRTAEKYSVADPDPGSGTFLTPGSGIRDGKKQDPDPG